MLPHTFPLEDRVFGSLLDEILRKSFQGLFEDLCCCEWYVREHEVVNLFVFGHLVPLFQHHQLDLTSIGIEVQVLQVDSSPLKKRRYGARKDVVIWSQPKMTPFKGVDLTGMKSDLIELRGPGQKPFAVMEWKHISRFTKRPKTVCAAEDLHSDLPCRHIRCEHERDKEWLRENLRGGMLRVGYAVLIDHNTHPAVTLRCRKFSSGSEEDFLTLPAKAGILGVK
jgi:hypothetical protein